ncbi:MAG TPA: sigma-70 family RNA polymerase sigma factor [Isosphaeraceae bacterium]|jgi:RNA polymerase sigma-70 factor (ECF subfamily)|nr:sigma-70 family RNA polymerase sigma factor [Isosphaeraceae bacterium]
MAPSAPDTDALLRQASEGDDAARQQLLDRHRDRLRRMVAVRIDPRLSARVDPSDVVQDALARASQKLDAYMRNRPLPFYPWLRQFAWERLVELHRQHVLAQRRSVTREQREEFLLSDSSAVALAEVLIASGTSPSHQLIRAELCARVRDALAELSPRDREVLVMRHLEQLSTAEVASILRTTEGAVMTRHTRALVRLRGMLWDNPSETRP